MFSENEICSLEDIANRYGLSNKSPMLYAIYIHENPLLTEDEKIEINNHIDKLKKRESNINKLNLSYLNEKKD